MQLGNFDFYREAKNNYKHIVPSKEAGLVLFSLYEKMENGSFENNQFSEHEIIKIIEDVFLDIKGDISKRNEYERNNDIILKLQEFFLWRDDRKKLYSFKSYGLDFCRNIKEQLFQYYSPTEIKSIFDSLVTELKNSLKIENGFLIWIKIHFTTRSTELSRQIEILDQQVSEAVKTFRSRITSTGKNAIEVINDALESLETIKQNSDEFRRAFHGTYEIEELIFELQEGKSVSDEDIKKIRLVRDFIRQIRAHLEQVSKRIDQIQPRIREFIHDFNQKDFDRKTELFIKYLLKTTSVGSDGSKKMLICPASVPIMYYKQNTAVFSIIIKKEIGFKRPLNLCTIYVNTEKRHSNLKYAKSKQLIRQRVAFWVASIQDDLNKNNSLHFTPYFYEILSAESSHSFTIAVKVAHKVVIKFSQSKHYYVRIENKFISHKNYTNTSLWKMLIERRQ